MTVEELQIIISAKTEKVTAKIDKLKEKIASVQPKKAADVNVTTSKAQGNLKKLQAEIGRTQAKIDKLNQKMAGIYEKQDAIVNKYTGLPNLTGMTKDQSFDFMVGNDPQMQKLNAQLDQLDAQTAPLKAHLAEVQAQISAAGNASGAAAEKTGRLSRSMKNASGNIRRAGQSSGYFGRMTRRMLLSMLLYRGVSFVFQSISEGFQNMALGSSRANSTMSQLASSALYLKNSIAAALMPALQALTPVIVRIADAISWAANKIAIFIAQITGQKTVTISKKPYVDYAKSIDKAGTSASSANKKVKELQRTIMGFDELNVLNKDVNSITGGSGPKSQSPDYSSMFETIKTPALKGFEDFKKRIKGFFDTLKDGSGKAQKALDKVKNKASEAAKELSKVKLPALGAWKIPEFPKIKVPAPDTSVYDRIKKRYQQTVRAPTFARPTVPSLLLADFLKSKSQYQKKVTAPTVIHATAPAIVMNDFISSRTEYQKKITAPEMQTATAPAVNLKSKFEPSIQAAKQKIFEFSASTQITVSAWGQSISNIFKKSWSYVSNSTATSLSGVKNTIRGWGTSSSGAFTKIGDNIMINTRKTFAYIPTAVIGGLKAAGKVISSWIPSVSKGFVNFGKNLMQNAGKTAEGMYSSFVAGLSAMWGQFTGFMSGVGKKINEVWIAHKSWVAPAAVDLIGLGAAAIAVTGGAAAIPAIAALAPVGLAAGGLVTGPTFTMTGEGKYPEAVLPLNDDVYSRIGKGIQNSGNGSVSDEAVELLHSIDHSLKQGHSINLRMDVDGKPFVNRIIKEVNNRNKRYHPVLQD
jgi:uncharacterized protein YlxW (UPF0749 family)